MFKFNSLDDIHPLEKEFIETARGSVLKETDVKDAEDFINGYIKYIQGTVTSCSYNRINKWGQDKKESKERLVTALKTK